MYATLYLKHDHHDFYLYFIPHSILPRLVMEQMVDASGVRKGRHVVNRAAGRWTDRRPGTRGVDTAYRVSDMERPRHDSARMGQNH